jgi:hypothetical protein
MIVIKSDISLTLQKKEMVIAIACVLVIPHKLLDLFVSCYSIFVDTSLYKISNHVIFDIAVEEMSILSSFKAKRHGL